MALLQDHFHAAHPGVRAALEGVIATLATRGAGVERVPVPYYETLAATYRTIVLYEAHQIHGSRLEQEPQHFGETMRASLEQGRDISRQQYQQAMDQRARFIEAMERLLTAYTALLCPTTLVPAPLLGQREVELNGRLLSTRQALLSCTSPYSMAGFPACSVPMGQVDKMPVGLQLIGRRMGDLDLLSLAEVCENLA